MGDPGFKFKNNMLQRCNANLIEIKKIQIFVKRE